MKDNKQELTQDNPFEGDDPTPEAETKAGAKTGDKAGAEASTQADTEASTQGEAETLAEEEGPPPTTEDPNLQPTEAEPVKSGRGEPIITIKGVFKSFKDHDVLRGIDMHVYKGENVVILGKSGSGKSVLIKCLVGLETPDVGEIDIFGQDISRLSYDELNAMRVRIGFLFQNGALYDSMTVRENLAFPLRQHKKTMTKEKKDAVIAEMLDNVGLADSIDQLPSKLSGGQSKRIGLARTLILRPELMLYDEPTTGLDTGTAREISELIVKMKEKYKISSITITHDMACAKLTADRIIMMKEGAVYAEGSYEELEKSEDEWIKTFFY
jgi:phospholipid/cholesterol/gamma-HCH transport system ATP-binding protein